MSDKFKTSDDGPATDTDQSRSHAQWVSLWSAAQTPSDRHALRRQLPMTPMMIMGCRFILHPADNFTELKMWETGKPPEHAATAFLAEALQGMNPVIVDVGANAGAFFLPLHMAGGPKTRSIVFEPNPTMRDRLHTNIALNGQKSRVRVFDCAVSDEDGSSELFFPRNGNLGQGRIDVAYPQKGASRGDRVSVRTLPSCLADADVDRVDFLKVDVEGLEDRVIAPLLSGPARLVPRMIYFEVAHDHVWTYPLADLLARAGFTLMERFGENALYLRED